MNKEILRKWSAALRSGKYEQGGGRLITERKDNSTEFCCLGVLCEIEGLPRKNAGYVMPENNETLWAYPSTEFLSKVFSVGLREAYDFSRELASMNDNNKSFSEIADRIDEKANKE